MKPTYYIEPPLDACYREIREAIWALEPGDALIIRAKHGRTTLTYAGRAVSVRGRPLPQPLRDEVVDFNERQRRSRPAAFVRTRRSARAR